MNRFKYLHNTHPDNLPDEYQGAGYKPRPLARNRRKQLSQRIQTPARDINCPFCYGESRYMGTRRKVAWFRCRNCGNEFSKTTGG